MRCKRVWKILPIYVTGELAAAKAATVRQHLGRCEGCAKEEGALRRVLELTAEMPLYRSTREGERPAKVTLSQAAAVERFIRARHGVSPAWRTAAAVLFLAASALAFAQARDVTGGRQYATRQSPARIESPGAGQVVALPAATPRQPAAVPVPSAQQATPKPAVAAKRSATRDSVANKPRRAAPKLVESPEAEPAPRPAESTPSAPPKEPTALAAAPPIRTYYVSPAPAVAAPAENEAYVIREVPAWAWLYPPTRFSL
jgi:hypothetical protein